MQGKKLSQETVEQLSKLNGLLRPFQNSLKELNALTARTAQTPGVLSDASVTIARTALIEAMKPALDAVNAILFEHHGFRLGDRIDLTFRHSGYQARVCPQFLRVYSHPSETERYVRVDCLWVLKSGELGVKEYDFTLQGENLDIEVLRPC